MNDIFPLGALPDDRSPALRVKDYSVNEIAGAVAVTPFLHEKPTALGATKFSQEYTSSCVPHGFQTQLEYEGIIAPPGLSQLRSYRKRANYPNPGSIGVDMYDKIREGQRANADAPVMPGHTEAMANALPVVVGEKLIKDFKYFQYINAEGALALDQVPVDVATGKAVAIFIYATMEEWSQEYVAIKDPSLSVGNAAVRHCVCIIPRGDFTEGGIKWLAVHDSAAFGGRHLRYISFDFLLKRCYFAAKVIASGEIITPPPQPIGKPTLPCVFGDRGDAVKRLQAFLVEGKYLEPQYVTGNYGALTAKAVLWWQLYNHLKFTVDIPKLLEWGGKYWGQQSITIINK